MINHARRVIITVLSDLSWAICARLYMYDFILKSSHDPRKVDALIVPL